MTQRSEWMAIANPVSGFGKVQKKWNTIKAELDAQQVDFDFEFTTPERRGNVLMHEAIRRGYRKIICVGGDGHLHDLVNGLMSQKEIPSTEVTISMISLGTGNDWIKTNGIPKDYKKAITVIKAGKTYIQNVGYAVADNKGYPVSSYFHNFAGVGFDAYVVQNTIRSKAYGQMAYLLVMLRSLFSYRKPILRITFDNAVVETICYLTLTGIGRYGGGGMKLTPGAEPDGDTFYTSIAKDFSKIDVFRYTGRLYDGSFIELDKAEAHRSKHVKIEVLSSEEDVYMEADGDVIGTGPFEISLIPKALKVVIP
ncbi:MAG: dgkA [Bacteroidetes bacterium]|nr:dgkA [Bacteroidota bacterium]